MKKITLFLSTMAIGIFLASTTSCKEKYNTNAEETSIKTIYGEYADAVAAKDVSKIMSFYAPGNELQAFDAFIPREYKGALAYQKDYEGFFSSFPGTTKSTITNLFIKVSGNFAYTTCIDQWTITGSDKKVIDMIFRCTDVLEKRNGKWLIVHEHLSFPTDPLSGKADYLSK